VDITAKIKQEQIECMPTDSKSNQIWCHARHRESDANVINFQVLVSTINYTLTECNQTDMITKLNGKSNK
jgi:hypothetical protein